MKTKLTLLFMLLPTTALGAKAEKEMYTVLSHYNPCIKNPKL